MSISGIRKLTQLAEGERRRFLRRSGSEKTIRSLCVDSEFAEVQNGPFRGVRLSVSDWDEWTTAPKVVGSYEAELHPTIKSICEIDYEQIINIGAAEGYYAVGLALIQRDAFVHAFEGVSHLREQCALNARAHGVEERIKILGECDPVNLKQLLLEKSGRKLVVCDCEGQELEILSGELLELLTGTDLLVEVHETAACKNQPESAVEILTRRFRSTHSVTMIPTRNRKTESYAALNSLEWDEKPIVLSEHRRQSKGWLLIQAQ